MCKLTFDESATEKINLTLIRVGKKGQPFQLTYSIINTGSPASTVKQSKLLAF